jgi:GntR family histidine utilization transcriptional repressor
MGGILDNSLLPRYSQVKRMILDRIETGEWPAKHRIPSESELVRDLSVSRMTINRALRELTLEGRLVRVQGVGTFVAEAKMQSPLIEIRNIADEITERGHMHSAKVVALEKLTVSNDIIASLDLPLGADIFHSVLVHHENGIPVQLEDRFIDPQLASDYLNQDFTQITPYVYLTEIAPISEAEHVIEAVLPVTWERRLLKCDSHEPCIQLQRTTWSGLRKVSWARLLYPGSRYRLTGRFNFKGGA